MEGSILLPPRPGCAGGRQKAMRAIVFVTALLAFTAQRDNPRPFVVLSHPSIVEAETPGYEELAFELTNHTAKAVTGWGIRYEVTFADGTKRSGGRGVLGPLQQDASAR